MQHGQLALVSICLIIGSAAVCPDDPAKDKPAAGPVKLPESWGESVKVKDLTDEVSESAIRMGQNLKKPSDFDKFLKTIHTEGHLIAILAALVQEHPEAGGWKGAAVQIQEQGLVVAKAAEAKGAKNLRTAQEAHKKILESIKKKEAGDRVNAGPGEPTTDWTSLGALGDIMKRVDPGYKYIRGKMSSEAAFKKDAELIRHNAAMLYIYGQISPDFRPTESDMPKLSASMSSAALELIDAVTNLDFAKANEANTAINNSCNECHKAKRFNKKGSDLDF